MGGMGLTPGFLTFFLGGIGLHKFYLSKNLQGIFYQLLVWTGIPGIIALVEFFIYHFTSEERLNEKYTTTGSTPVIIGVVGVILLTVLGLLAAIALPPAKTTRYAPRLQQA